MSFSNGQSRVIIENVQPQVDGGLYPAKRCEGESVTVTADIFGDGHDHIRGQVLYKKPKDKTWNIIELKATYSQSMDRSFRNLVRWF
jgi:starch synthase (maltosyl-transferring)